MSSVLRNIPQRINSYDLVKEVNGGNSQLIANEFWTSNALKYTLTCVVAAFSLTGTTTNVTTQKNLPATQAIFNVIGNNIIFADALPITTGSFTLIGLNSVISTQRKLAPPQATFSETGNVVNLVIGRKITAAQSSFNLTGNTIIFADKLSVTTGFFGLTGNNSGVLAQRKLIATTSGFTQTGNNANFIIVRTLSVSNGSFNLTGNNIIFADQLPVTVGLFYFTGIDSQITRQKRLTASTCSFSLDNSDINLIVSRTVKADPQVYSLVGNSLIFADGLFVTTGEFLFTGNNVNLTYTQGATLVASKGAFNLTGKNAFLKHGQSIHVTKGIFNVAYRPVKFHRSIISKKASFIVDGKIINFKSLIIKQNNIIMEDSPIDDMVPTPILKFDTHTNLANTATIKRIVYINPNGKEGYWDVDSVENSTVLVYALRPGDIDISGIWRLRSYIENSLNEGYGKGVSRFLQITRKPFM